MKRVFLFLLMAAGWMAGFADHFSLWVTLRDQTEAIFVVSESFVISFADGEMRLESDSEPAAYAVADIESFGYFFTQGLADASAAPTIELRGDCIAVRFPGIEAVDIYDASGRLVATLPLGADGSASLRGLPSGAYIAKAGSLPPIKVALK